jgi:adenosylcobinamide-GDP ribazoletransferase
MWADLRAAFSFLTILPFGYAEDRKPGWSFTWYPMVGLVIGLLMATIAQFSPFADGTTAFLVLLAWVVITGGLHLDGFGDSCDGLLATVEPARRLEIMKDPRAGSWAVVGLILLLLGKWTIIAGLSPLLLILPPIIGRWGMVLAVYRFPYARSSDQGGDLGGGLGGYFRDGLGRWQVILATLIALLAVVTVARDVIPVLIGLIIGGLVVFFVGNWAAKRLGGGITGDVYGALCELIELGCLVGLGLWANG